MELWEDPGESQGKSCKAIFTQYWTVWSDRRHYQPPPAVLESSVARVESPLATFYSTCARLAVSVFVRVCKVRRQTWKRWRIGLEIGSISAFLSVLPAKSVRERSTGSFPEQRLVIKLRWQTVCLCLPSFLRPSPIVFLFDPCSAFARLYPLLFEIHNTQNCIESECKIYNYLLYFNLFRLSNFIFPEY